MTESPLARLRRLEQAATPGPWGSHPGHAPGLLSPPDSELVAQLRNLAPRLLDLWEAVQRFDNSDGRFVYPVFDALRALNEPSNE